MQKIRALESLRGLAALIVVFAHFAYAFFPAMVVGPSSAYQHSVRGELAILHSPLNILVNGQFAVVCFFVLSGFVLSYGYFSKNGVDLVKASLRRYFRLAPIVFTSVFLSYLFLKLELYHTLPAAYLTHSPWLAQFWQQDTTFPNAVWQAFIGVFAAQPTPKSLNPVLWTIYYEFIGSILVFALLALIGRDRRRWIIYPILLVIFSNTFYVGFVAGMMLCDVVVNKFNLFNKLAFIRKGYKLALIVIALYFASFPAYLTLTKDLGLIHLPLVLFENVVQTQNMLYVTASVIMVSLLLTSMKIRKLFEAKPLVALGGISYSLYATHLLMLGTIGCGVFILLAKHLPYNYAVLVTLVAYLLSTIIVASIFRKYIDVPSITLSRNIGTYLDPKHIQEKKEGSPETIL